MKNSKLMVMGLTFIILIAITPLIFGKIMNSKYNQMLNNLREKGMIINVVKDKSSYFQTDKVLEITIPQKLLDTNGVVDEIKLSIETKFKNLPVTQVKFIGHLDKIVLGDQYKDIEQGLNKFLTQYIKFVVTTPNFRDYAYKLNDIVIDNQPTLGIKGIKGTFTEGNLLKNNLSINDIYVKDQKGFVEIKNFNNKFEGDKKSSLSQTNFNVNVDLNKLQLQIQNVYSKTKTLLNDQVSVNTTFGFKTLNIPNMVNADDFKVNAEINGLEKKTLEKFANANSMQQDELLNEIFEKGFNINLNSNLTSVKAMGRDFGGYNVNLKIKFLPTKNFKEKVNSNNIDFVDATLHLETSQEIANMLKSMNPQSSMLFNLAKKENSKVILNLELKNGKLYSEGQLIQ